ncbi:hypothetical protein [Nocardia sp. R7R-8]|uniref:hypothetical protein n=1 Tax=Nocardia sp. R7R-8 TaxID=3459304 RepID=UPI00403E056D
MKIRYLIVTALTVPMLSGCYSTVAQEEPCDTNIFSFGSGEEPLGSYSSFNKALSEAGKAPNPVTLGDVTRAAGWTDGWDRMIDVFSPTTAEELHNAAHTTKDQVCWKNWPTRKYTDDAVPEGYYLFLANGKPVQAVRWSLDQSLLSLGRLPELTPHSVLVPDPHGPGLIPAP